MATNNMDKIDKILCPSCLTENDPKDVFCSKCNASIGQQATIDPVTSAISEGRAMTDAIRQPKKLIIVIGMWLFYGTAIAVYLIILIGTQYKDIIDFGIFNAWPFVIFGTLILFCLFFPILTTRNYLRYKKSLKLQ
jgi:hypothetical protein